MTSTTRETLSALSDDELSQLRYEAETVGNQQAVEDCWQIQAARYMANTNEMIGHLDPRYYPV